MDQLVLGGILLVTLLIQAVFPAYRLLLVTSGAALASLGCAAFGHAGAAQLLAEVPWDVMVLLVALGLISHVLAQSRVFGVLALWVTRRAKARPARVLAWFSVGMYVVSGIVNNLTALMLVLPVLLILLQLMGVDRRYVAWCLGTLLVACNLGGAATPIGDFPAILLLGRGSMRFDAYLGQALPPTLLALGLLLAVVTLVVRPWRAMGQPEHGGALTVAVMQELYRNTKPKPRLLWPSVIMLGLMFVGWTALPREWGVTPELVAWLGAVVVLLSVPRLGEAALRRHVDLEAGLFLLGLFVMVGAVRHTGLFRDAAQALLQLPVEPVVQRMLFVALAGVLTGIFSAGPSMAALLEVAEAMVQRGGHAYGVYVGLALGVCAGSSLLLTAATSGPLAQALTERADLRDHAGRPVRFGLVEFGPVGITGFSVILVVALLYTAMN